MTATDIRDVTEFDLAITGVFALNTISDEVISYWQDNGIDPDAEQYEEQIRHDWEESEHGEDEEFDMSDYWDGYQQSSILVGFQMVTGKSYQYEPDETADYSAIVGLDNAFGGTVQVVRSKFYTRSAMCSPCFPGQADGDTPGSFICFSVTPDDISEYSDFDKTRIFTKGD